MAMLDYSGSDCWTPRPAGAPPVAWKEDVDPADAWHALMQGEWTVVEHDVCMGTLVARLVSPQTGRETLRTEDLCVAIGRARGASIKALAFETGRPYGTVADCIAKVMRKLRLRSPAELVVLFHQASAALPCAAHRPEGGSRAYAPRHLSATRVRYGGGDHLVLTYPAPRWSLPPCLSISEERIVLELIAGDSQHAIARRHGTAARTVANQVASIYQKVKVHSRIELFVALRAQ